MSLFLGKIHYWMFEKIQWFEGIEEEIVKWAGKQGLPVEEWTKQIYGQFGKPTEKKPLDEVIDNDNIHGWLQEKIENAELRQASLITEILKKDPGFKKDIASIFENQGSAAAREHEGTVGTPEEMYNVLNNFLLEGMPCDRVTEFLNNDECEFVWQTVQCLHTPHWDRVSGDANNFYDLREAWIKGFVNTINQDFDYMRLPDRVHKIVNIKCAK